MKTEPHIPGGLLLIAFFILSLLADPPSAGGDDGAQTAAAPDGDQFRQAVMDLVADAVRRGKEIRINKVDYGTDGARAVLGPGENRPSRTSVVAVEIRDPGSTGDIPPSELLRNQEEMIRNLDEICREQLESGRRISRLSGSGEDLGRQVSGLASGMDQGRNEAAALSSEISGVTENGRETENTMRGIRAGLESLDRTVDGLLESMGSVSRGVDGLAEAVEERNALPESENPEPWSAGEDEADGPLQLSGETADRSPDDPAPDGGELTATE